MSLCKASHWTNHNHRRYQELTPPITFFHRFFDRQAGSVIIIKGSKFSQLNKMLSEIPM